MKKRIIVSSIITVIFALIIVTYSFIGLLNVRELEKVTETLKVYNKIIINSKEYAKEYTEFMMINNNRIQYRVLKANGDIVFSSSNFIGKYELKDDEIKRALKDGEVSVVRYSEDKGKDLVYCITKINEDLVLVSAIPSDITDLFTKEYLICYLIIITLVIVLSLGLSLKLVRGIIHPLKELELATSKIANGDLNKRATIYANDEIGSLARTFNNMANLLQQKIEDSVDKQNKLESILESMESGVIAIDNKHRVMLINPYAKKIFGINTNVIGETLTKYVTDRDVLTFIKGMSQIETREIKIDTPIEREIRIKKSPIISGIKSYMGIVITIQDMTEIKRLENVRSEFVANVSHELRTPLTSIKGFAETLRYVNDDTTRDKFLDIIDTEAERLTRLISDILVLSKIESDNTRVDEEFNIEEVIENVINMVKLQGAKRSIEIKYIKSDVIFLMGEKDRFVQLILNLIENSIKYSDEKKTIYIKTYKKSDGKYLEVIDEGIGIPEEDLPRIFERFYRVDKSRAKGGTGLGLAIVKHIVKIFNGEIFVESALGKGTKFTMIFKDEQYLENCEY